MSRCKGVGTITTGYYVNQIMIGKPNTGLDPRTRRKYSVANDLKAQSRMFLVWKVTILETRCNAADDPSNQAMKDRFTCITPHKSPEGLWC